MSKWLFTDPGNETVRVENGTIRAEFWAFVKRNFALSIITALMGISGLGLIAFLFYAALNSLLSDPSVGLIISIALFFLGTLMSYVLTAFGSQITRKDELRDLGRTSASHLALLRSKIRTLSETIIESPLGDGNESVLFQERMSFIEYTLRILAYDAGASTSDIASMAKLAEHDVEAILNEAEIRSREDRAQIERVAFSCPHCSRPTEDYMPKTPNATRHIVCMKCKEAFSIHRLPDGSLKTSTPNSKKNFAITSVRTPATKTIVRIPIQLASGQIRCPKCGWKIQVNVKEREANGPLVRNCFECFERIAIDPNSLEILSSENRHPISVDSKQFASGRGPCPACSDVVASMPIRNTRNELIQSCPSCGVLHKLETQGNPEVDAFYQERLAAHNTNDTAEVTCPNKECGAVVSFKLHKNDPESFKFCYECKTRLKYHAPSKTVESLEQVTPISLDRQVFLREGRKCPHCNHVSYGGFTTNLKGEKLSVCWNCKGLMQFT